MFSMFYEEVIKRGIEHDHHESDLYVPVNDSTKKLVKDLEHRTMVSTFKNNIDGSLWYEIPFAYTPWWEERAFQNI